MQVDSMRVNGYPHTAIIVTLIAESTINKGIEAIYESMRVKSSLTFLSEVITQIDIEINFLTIARVTDGCFYGTEFAHIAILQSYPVNKLSVSQFFNPAIGQCGIAQQSNILILFLEYMLRKRIGDGANTQKHAVILRNRLKSLLLQSILLK